MRRALLYVMLSILFGLSVTLLPVVAIPPSQGGILGNIFSSDRTTTRISSGLVGSSTLGPQGFASDLGVLLGSFLIAMLVYLLIRRKLPDRDSQWTRMPP